jgi:hypothetical protein
MVKTITIFFRRKEAMKMRERKMSFLRAGIVFTILAVFLMCGTGWAQTHDLVMEEAPDLTSMDPGDWKSPDIKLGSDFGDDFPPDIVRRGVANPIYARFYINGTQDYLIPSYPPLATAVKIKFYWRHATLGDAPPDLDDTSWQEIPGELPVTYDEAGGEDLYLTLTWPDNFPSVTTKSLDWTPPDTGTYFHVAAQVVYPPDYADLEYDKDNNVAISLYESILGLRDVDVVLVMDASGSMDDYSYEGDYYIEHAQDKAGLFVYSMPGTGAHKASVVSFSTLYAGDNYKDIWPTPTASLTPVTNTNKDDIVGEVNLITVGGGTPMGAGLQRAIDILTAVPLAPDRKRAILLLSDGYDNSGTPRACQYTADVCVPGDILSQLQDNHIRVFSVALGEYAWEECLECLATNTGGQWYGAIDPGVDLAEVLLDMQQAYTADDLYRADRGVSGGNDDTYSIYFEGRDKVLYFMLAWDNLGSSLGLELRPPRSRRWINPETVRTMTVDKGRGYQVVRVNRPVRGAWSYRVTGKEGEKYLAAVRSNRVRVRLGMDVVAAGQVGYPIEITAQLMDGKKPVKTENITATVQVPVVSLNTVLQKASRSHMLRYKTPPVDPRILVKKPDLSVRSVFINKLKGKKQRPLVKTKSVKVPLKYVGKGLYKGVLDEKYTTAAGKYDVTVTCNEKTFQRNFSKQLRLKPGKVNFKKSSFDVLPLKTNEGESWLLCVYPTDRFGNAVTCPSLTKDINAGLEKGKLVRTPKVVLGAFHQKLSVAKGQKPKLSKVTVKGNRIKQIERTR